MVNGMKEEVKELWRLCFGDSEAFTELYFRLRYTDDINIAIRQGNRIVSALQMIPYPMTLCGQTVRTAYISGACTHPEFRGQGSMRELLAQSFRKMFCQQVCLTTLIPAEEWFFGYYARFGYASVFQYTLKQHTLTDAAGKLPSPIRIERNNDNWKDAYEYFHQKQSERKCYLQHTPEDFHVVMSDLNIGGGSLFTLRQENLIKGMAIVYQGSPYPTIQELVADSEAYRHMLLQAIGQQSHNRQLNEICPAENPYPVHPLGMARIIRAAEVLELYASAFPDKEIDLQLTDNELPDNNGYYHLHEGKCSYSRHPHAKQYHHINIRRLTEQILQPLHPYMSLMLN